MTSDNKSCISGKGVTKIFGIGNKCNIAVDHVDFEFRQGEVISIVGESGSGKTTLFKVKVSFFSMENLEILVQERREKNIGKIYKRFFRIPLHHLTCLSK